MSGKENFDAIHILVRFADSLFDVGDTIERHRKVLKREGAVVFGKVGKPLGMQHVKRINEQVESGKATYVYLVQKSSDGYEFSRGRILQVFRTLPEGHKKYVPRYYETHGILNQISLWFKLSDIRNVEKNTLRKLHIASSGRDVTHSLARSMAAIFILKEGEGYIH